jgi:hypothetical protein
MSWREIAGRSPGELTAVGSQIDGAKERATGTIRL